MAKCEQVVEETVRSIARALVYYKQLMDERTQACYQFFMQSLLTRTSQTGQRALAFSDEM